MRMMKCYLANDSNGCFVMAKEVSSLEKCVRTCVSCHCLLVWHSGGHGEVPWCEHDQQSVSRGTLMKCAYLDPQVKADERHAELHKAVGWLITPLEFKIAGNVQVFTDALAACFLTASGSEKAATLMPTGTY
ncbi:conserved hypothetical protein [Enterobacterales bacterium 8AC]|nr:conserved hypothetical protein [Enterobacterales bacterium 8AC]